MYKDTCGQSNVLLILHVLTESWLIERLLRQKRLSPHKPSLSLACSPGRLLKPPGHETKRPIIEHIIPPSESVLESVVVEPPPLSVADCNSTGQNQQTEMHFCTCKKMLIDQNDRVYLK